MNSNLPQKEVTVDFPGLIRVYKDGSVERLWNHPILPPSLDDPDTGVASKDVTISPSTGLSARLYLPKLTQTQPKLPVLVYFHGGGFQGRILGEGLGKFPDGPGGFFVESAFSSITHPYINKLTLEARVLIVSVEYRLAPEHPLPAAYDDCWEALNWVVSGFDPWLSTYGDINALFIGGDSSGANIVHNIAMKAGSMSLNDGVQIVGAFLSQGFFLDQKIEELETGYMIWEFVYPNAAGGRDSPMVNPFGDGAPSLCTLGCSRLLVVVCGDDVMRGSGVRYYNAVKESGYKGTVELFEVEGEGHGFHVFNPDCQNAKLLLKRLGSFLSK